MDPLLWGEALGSKLAAYIEELRKSDSTLGLAEMAAARGGGRTDDPQRNSPLGGTAATGKLSVLMSVLMSVVMSVVLVLVFEVLMMVVILVVVLSLLVPLTYQVLFNHPPKPPPPFHFALPLGASPCPPLPPPPPGASRLVSGR